MWLCNGRDHVDEAQGGKGPACPADCEHEAGHNDGGGAVRTAASNCCAGASPLRWDLATERRGVAGDHEATRSACLY